MPRPKGSKNKKKVEIVQNTPRIYITLTLGKDVLKGEGSTFAEAFDSIKKPNKIITKGTLFVSNGVDSKILPLQPLGVKRLFYPIARQVIIKNLAFGLR